MDDIQFLLNWFSGNYNLVHAQHFTTLPPQLLADISARLVNISNKINDKFPELAQRIKFLNTKLALNNYCINVEAFDRIAELINAIKNIYDKENNSWKYIHSKFCGMVRTKFLQGHYQDAVTEATNIVMLRLKIINKHIDNKCDDIDGSNLVGKLFSASNTEITLFDLQTRTNKDKQAGYSEFFRGWVSAIRNRNAHPYEEKMDEVSAFQEIAFMSILMRVLDNRVSPQIFEDEESSR